MRRRFGFGFGVPCTIKFLSVALRSLKFDFSHVRQTFLFLQKR